LTNKGMTSVLEAGCSAAARDTGITATVEQGLLSISALVAADLGTGDPGTTLSGQLVYGLITTGR
jgi:hypothetical protein